MSDVLMSRLKSGAICAEHGEQCRVMNAESGCTCAEAAALAAFKEVKE